MAEVNADQFRSHDVQLVPLQCPGVAERGPTSRAFNAIAMSAAPPKKRALALHFRRSRRGKLHDTAAYGFVELVKDRPGDEQALRCAKRPLHYRQSLVTEHGFDRREIGVGTQHEETSNFASSSPWRSGEMAFGSHREEAAIALVADEGLTAFIDLLPLS